MLLYVWPLKYNVVVDDTQGLINMDGSQTFCLRVRKAPQHVEHG